MRFTARPKVIAAVLLTSMCGIAVVDQRPSSAVTTRTYVRTFVGTDFRSLDGNMLTQLFGGSGGGIYAFSNAPIGAKFLELNVDLPVGARVTNVTFYFRDCVPAVFPQSSYYFGSYNPVTSNWAEVVNMQGSHSANCNATRSVTRTGSPLATVVVGRRYTLGMAPLGVSNDKSSTGGWGLIGARISYTCTELCA
jgi:hypothetical protein